MTLNMASLLHIIGIDVVLIEHDLTGYGNHQEEHQVAVASSYYLVVLCDSRS